jgi:hypothetical protein
VSVRQATGLSGVATVGVTGPDGITQTYHAYFARRPRQRPSLRDSLCGRTVSHDGRDSTCITRKASLIAGSDGEDPERGHTTVRKQIDDRTPARCSNGPDLLEPAGGLPVGAGDGRRTTS